MKYLKIIGVLLLLLGLSAAGGYWLLWNGYIWLNMPSLSKYPVQGLDVSAHQGQIDWPQVARGPWSFVYVKATEGGDFKDPSFQANWQASSHSGLQHGAYHFFTFCRQAREQAANFIATVPRESDSLPAAIDLEFGGNCKNKPSPEVILQEVGTMRQLLQQHYGKAPILYVTQSFAQAYFKQQAFGDAQLWVRDILREPQSFVGREWLFWQFSNRGRVPGIKGFVDQNVFKGSPAAFRRWGQGVAK